LLAKNTDMSATSARQSLELALLGLLESASQCEDPWQADQARLYLQHLAVLRALGQQEKLRGFTAVVTLLERSLAQATNSGALPAAEVAACLADWPALALTELLPPEPSPQACPWDLLHSLQALPWFTPLSAEATAYVESRLAEEAAFMLPAIQPKEQQEPQEAEVKAEAVPLDAPAEAPPELSQEDAPLPSAPADQAEAESIERPAELPTASVAAEELEMVADALAALQLEVLPAIDAAQSEDETSQALMHYEEQVANVLNAAVHLGLTGLEKVLQTVLVNVAMLQATPEQCTPQVRVCIANWVPLAIAYVGAPNQREAAQALALANTDTAWPYPTDSDTALAWVDELVAVELVSARVQEDRVTVATSADVDLSIPRDIESNVLDSLLFELPLHAQNFTTAVQRLQGGNQADLETARRIAHTLKGAGNTAGIRGIGNLTHVVEEVLLAFGRVQRLPTPGVQAGLVEAADCLEAMSEALTSGAPAPAEALPIYQKMLDWIVQIERTGLPTDEADLSSAPRSDTLLPLQTEHDTADAAITEHHPEGEAVLRVPVSLIEQLLKLVDQDAIIAAQMQERITRLNEEVLAQRASSRQFRQLSSELEQLVDVRGLAMMGGSSHGLDSLEMDQYNELHVLTRRIVEAGADGREFVQAIDGDVNGLRDLAADKDRLLAQMQSSIQRTRMVPVTSVVPRLQRAVRQAARVLNRSAQLRVEGEATLVDSQLLNAILDALMHLLRNAVDHGIEPAALRLASGKPALGTIVLSFISIGSNLAISCSDDGSGFDLNGILGKAQALGLVPIDAVLTADQTMRLVLRPGFSTRDEATHISGRGLGLSIVHKAVQDLRGTLDLSSPAGSGSRFDMRFPVQLSAKQVMLSNSRQHQIAISEHGLEQLLPVDAQLLDAHTYLLGTQRLPVKRLDALLGLPVNALRDIGEHDIVMIVLGDQRERTAVIGPELRESRRVIVKPLHRFIPAVLGMDGVTILGDGSVATVIDLPDLLRGSALDTQAPSAMPFELQPLPVCLVVDDSVSVRRTMEHLMQDAGFEVITARDGVEALALLDRYTPQVALVDLEMPRMNGLDLTSAMRNRPATAHTPVIMITSRFTDKHRALAQEAGVNGFLTKPYTEDTLLSMVDNLLSTADSPALLATH
jgi:chemotaxis protein histidine kinase CheA/ActR/RegA family two-component response regulator